ncbi:MAG: zf-HC2 domain-containing protein [Candidatus Rokubacteria bacterium]|nr:zf-HC2 domain-containing protein [Candidatus Rokubacteria bacterium]
MTCRDVIAVLADYLDATLGPADAETLEAHEPSPTLDRAARWSAKGACGRRRPRRGGP